MAEYEDGELLDSDEEVKKKIVASNTSLLYRNGNCSSDSSKSDSNNSDEEIELKRKKHHRQSFPATNNFSSKFIKAAQLFQNCQNISKKVNNIWGSVLIEQSLTQDLSKVDVQEETLKDDERGVESYHYWLKSKEEGGENDEQLTTNNFQRRGKKRNIKERLGKRTYDKKKIRNILVSESDPLEKVVAELADKLNEPKQDLIERVVQTLGTKKALELYFMTEDVEEAGGMMIFDGSRRRTPGGVYFQLLKCDSHITKDQRNAIFIDERRVECQRRKARVKRRKKKANNFQSMLAEAKKEQARRQKRSQARHENNSEEEKKDDARMNEENEDDNSKDDAILTEENEDNKLFEVEKSDMIELTDMGMSDLD